jgi:hypothetical protein
LRWTFSHSSFCRFLAILSGAYWHEAFVKDNRDLCLTISRIKAPKRRMGAQNGKIGGIKNAPLKGTHTMKAGQLMFQNDEGSTFLNPRLALCSHNTQPEHSAASMAGVSSSQLLSTTASLATSSKSQQQQGSEVETYQWLLNAGVPFSAFDPVALNDRQSNKMSSSELLDCADEITSLFATPASPTSSVCHSTNPAPVPSTLDASASLLSTFQNAYAAVSGDSSPVDVPLPVSPSVNSNDEHVALPDLLLGDDNWALW